MLHRNDGLLTAGFAALDILKDAQSRNMMTR